MSLKAGDQFVSYEELEQKIKYFESANTINLYKRDSKTLTSQEKRCPQRVQGSNQKLKYYRIVYSCDKGGKKYKASGSGIRHSSTCREDCPFQIVLSLSKDGQKLVVTHVVDIHNHSVHPVAYHNLSKQRKLSKTEKVEVQKLINLKCNRVMLKDYITSKSGKNVILRDISNIKVQDNRNSTDEEQLREIIAKLTAIPGATVDILVNEENILEGIFHQSDAMKRSFLNYPDILLLDATYKLNNLRMPLYILMIVNGNGEGEIVCSFLLAHETTVSIEHMMKIFQQNNAEWESTEVIYTDKDFTERQVLRKLYPKATLLLCLFHTLKAFRSSITTQAMNIDSAERENVLEILQSLTYATSVAEYESNYKKLLDLNLPLVTQYFNKNWHAIKEEWVECFKRGVPTFNVTTTNHLESFNNKIKQVCSKFNDLEKFYDQFLILLESISNERKTKATSILYKNDTTYQRNSVEFSYSALTTPHAFSFIEKQLQRSKHMTILNSIDDYCVILSKTLEEINVTAHNCSCSYYINMKLPCAHIFAVRSYLSKNVFEPSLIPKRFLKSHYVESCLGAPAALSRNKENSQELELGDFEISKIEDNLVPCTTQQQKYKKVILKCQQLATILSEMGSVDFEKHVMQLDFLMDNWNERKSVLIVPENEILYETRSDLTSTNAIEPESEQPNIELELAAKTNNDERVVQNATDIEPNDLNNNNDLQLNVLEKVKFPRRMKMKGRPKGLQTTVVGLHRRKTKKKHAKTKHLVTE